MDEREYITDDLGCINNRKNKHIEYRKSSIRLAIGLRGATPTPTPEPSHHHA